MKNIVNKWKTQGVIKFTESISYAESESHTWQVVRRNDFCNQTTFKEILCTLQYQVEEVWFLYWWVLIDKYLWATMWTHVHLCLGAHLNYYESLNIMVCISKQLVRIWVDVVTGRQRISLFSWPGVPSFLKSLSTFACDSAPWRRPGAQVVPELAQLLPSVRPATGLHGNPFSWQTVSLVRDDPLEPPAVDTHWTPLPFTNVPTEDVLDVLHNEIDGHWSEIGERRRSKRRWTSQSVLIV